MWGNHNINKGDLRTLLCVFSKWKIICKHAALAKESLYYLICSHCFQLYCPAKLLLVVCNLVDRLISVAAINLL